MAMASLIGIRLLALALLVAGALVAPAFAEGGDACDRYRQNRLVIGDDLQSRHFVLEATGNVERMPAFHSAEGRSIFHRRFAMSLDIVERVSLFESSARQTLVIARDRSGWPRCKSLCSSWGAPTNRWRNLRRTPKILHSLLRGRSMSAPTSRT